MKLSTRAEYGIRVLVALARAEGEGPQSLATVARSEKLPHAYLEQLVSDLRRAGLVTATRGKAGGYALARPAQDLSLVEAVRALDGPLLEMPCAGIEDLEVCDRPQDCSVHEVFQRSTLRWRTRSRPRAWPRSRQLPEGRPTRWRCAAAAPPQHDQMTIHRRRSLAGDAAGRSRTLGSR